MQLKPKVEDFAVVAMIIFVSLLVFCVFLLPSELRNILKVRRAVFSPFAYVAASFVHDDLQGLQSNLLVFILFMFLLYYISRKAGKKRFFFYSLLTLFVALPLVNYGLLFYSSIYESREFGYGLSLVDSGLIGLTVPSLILLFKDRLEGFRSRMFLFSLLFLTFCFVVLPYGGTSFFFLLSALCAILGFALGTLEFRRIFVFLVESFRRRETRVEACLVAFTFLFYFISIGGLFPSNIQLQGATVDIVSHFIGLLFGIAPFSLYACWGR